MPYITRQARGEIAKGRDPQTCGELNYCLTLIAIQHDTRKAERSLGETLFDVVARFVHSRVLNYQNINDVIGAVECCAMELERRRPNVKKFEVCSLKFLSRRVYNTFAAAYEIQKIVENGDIDYGPERTPKPS